MQDEDAVFIEPVFDEYAADSSEEENGVVTADNASSEIEVEADNVEVVLADASVEVV